MFDRRRFLAAGGALAATCTLPSATAAGSADEAPRWLGARADRDGRFHATCFDTAGRLRFEYALPTRGHGMAVHAARGEVVMCARRPGDWLVVLDFSDGTLLHPVTAAPGRFFNGHAVFIGDLLYASETATAAGPASAATFPAATSSPPTPGDGVIGVYDARAAYRRLGEFPSHGLDPHDLRAIDANTLVVANGGLLTHPDAPRVKLNVDTMAPSLAYFDARDGRLTSLHALAPELHQLSIRHLAVAADRTLVVAMQYEGPATDRPPLIGLHPPGATELELLALPEPALASLRNYCGSAAVDATGHIAGISSPRGGQTLLYDIPARRLIASLPLADGCGIAADGHAGGFVLTSGLGSILRAQAGGDAAPINSAALGASQWDNHLALLTR